jgi:hypothetical protein
MSMPSGKYWRDVAIALRRIRHDKRALARIIRLVARIFLAAIGITMLWLFVIDEPSNIFVLIVLLPAAGGAGWLVFKAKQEDPPTLPIAGVVKQYLENRTVIVAALLARAGSEIHFTQNQLPDGQQIVTRQILNQKLREFALWEQLEPAESALMSAPDQSWTMEQHQQTIAWCEQLRLLRWTLRIDAEMLGLEDQPVLDYTLARNLLEGKLPLSVTRYDRPPVLASWDLRAQRDASAAYVARLVAEARSRNLIAATPEIDEWAGKLRENALGPSKDLLIGSKTVDELDDQVLWAMMVTAWSRSQYAAYLTELLSRAGAFPFANWAQAIENGRA